MRDLDEKNHRVEMELQQAVLKDRQLQESLERSEKASESLQSDLEASKQMLETVKRQKDDEIANNQSSYSV